jgi:hypothetical protein
MWGNRLLPLPLTSRLIMCAIIMPRSFRLLLIALVLLAPVAVFAAMVAVDRTFGAPGRGHNYVVRITLPPAAAELDCRPSKVRRMPAAR